MIEKRFELKFLLKYIVSIIAGFAIILIALYLVLPRADVMHYYEAISLLIKTSDTLVRTFIIAGLIEFVFIIFVINFISILASHKIAGPIYRLEKTLENFADGDVTRTVRFRYYDPLRNVANTFNNSLKEIAQMFRTIEQANNNMNKAREKLDGTVNSIDKFKESVVALEKEIEKFKT